MPLAPFVQSNVPVYLYGCGLSFSIGYRAVAVASCASECGTLRLLSSWQHITWIQPYLVCLGGTNLPLVYHCPFLDLFSSSELRARMRNFAGGISHFAFRETGHFAFRILRNRTFRTSHAPRAKPDTTAPTLGHYGTRHSQGTRHSLRVSRAAIFSRPVHLFLTIHVFCTGAIYLEIRLPPRHPRAPCNAYGEGGFHTQMPPRRPLITRSNVQNTAAFM
jgi:hypothetical protein